jgi:hypothetical protein
MSGDEGPAHPLLSAFGFGGSVSSVAWLLPLDRPLQRDPLLLVAVGIAGTVAGLLLLVAIGRRAVATLTALLVVVSFAVVTIRIERGTWSGMPVPLLLVSACAAASWVPRSGSLPPRQPSDRDDRTRLLAFPDERRGTNRLPTRRDRVPAGPPMGVTELLAGRWAVLGAHPLPDSDQGGQSRVHLALDTWNPGRYVVAKLPGREHETQSAAWLAEEARLLWACRRSPYVVRLLDHGIDAYSGAQFVILAHYRLGSLARLLSVTSDFKLGWAVTITADLLRGVVDMHEHCGQPIVHGDLNPRNLLIGEGRPGVVICDLGTAGLAMRNTEDMTVPTGLLYSPWYGAPELLCDTSAWGIGVDIYGVAAVLYELVTGQPPFRRENMWSGQGFEALVRLGMRPASVGLINPDLPGGLIDLVDQCLATRPGYRSATAADVLGRLERACRGFEDLPVPFAGLRRWEGPTGRWSA